MILRVTTGRFEPARYEEVVRLNREQTTPTLQQVPGYQSLQVGKGRPAG